MNFLLFPGKNNLSYSEHTSCCRPSQYQTIKVKLYCDSKNYRLNGNYHNILSCSCQYCQGADGFIKESLSKKSQKPKKKESKLINFKNVTFIP